MFDLFSTVSLILITAEAIYHRQHITTFILNNTLGNKRLAFVEDSNKKFIADGKEFFKEKDTTIKFNKAIALLELQQQYFYMYAVKNLVVSAYFLIVMFTIRLLYGGTIFFTMPIIGGDVTWFPIFLATSLTVLIYNLYQKRKKKKKITQ